MTTKQIQEEIERRAGELVIDGYNGSLADAQLEVAIALMKETSDALQILCDSMNPNPTEHRAMHLAKSNARRVLRELGVNDDQD